MANSSLATNLEVGGLTAGEIIYSVLKESSICTYNQQDATLHNLFIFCEILYMFQAVSPPIIRSSKLYIQHRVLCQTFTATRYCRESDGTCKFHLFHDSGG